MINYINYISGPSPSPKPLQRSSGLGLVSPFGSTSEMTVIEKVRTIKEQDINNSIMKRFLEGDLRRRSLETIKEEVSSEEVSEETSNSHKIIVYDNEESSLLSEAELLEYIISERNKELNKINKTAVDLKEIMSDLSECLDKNDTQVRKVRNDIDNTLQKTREGYYTIRSYNI